MASGRAHATASLLLAISGIPIAIWTRDPLAGLCCAAGSACGVVLSPDLDVDHRTESEEVVWRFGCLPGLVFQWYWTGYALAIGHRKALSHIPGLGTTGRVLYALWIPAAVALALGWRPGALFAWYFGWWCAGLLVSDAAHFVMDGLPVH